MILVIDTETTGLSPDNDRVLEIAAVEVEADGTVGASHEYLLHYAGEIPAQARAVHHISPAEVRAVPPERTLDWALAQIGYADADYVAAHNSRFDSAFLPPREGWICTYKCAYQTFPSAPSYSNQVLRYHLNLEPILPQGLYPHRALYDALVTAELLSALLRSGAAPDQLVQTTLAPMLTRTCPWAAHKGKPWEQVPTDYLQVMLRKGYGDEDTRATVQHHLQQRLEGRY